MVEEEDVNGVGEDGEEGEEEGGRRVNELLRNDTRELGMGILLGLLPAAALLLVLLLDVSSRFMCVWNFFFFF